MQHESSEPILSAVFVDYDNVYLSLKRKSEEAAKRFAKDANGWIRAIASGELITPTNSLRTGFERRLVMNRCYGNPVPRRNSSDNTTDMNSFAFVRHHFLRSGFEIIDCPPLTAQLKNSSDIRMVMDIRDYLDHKTNFDEFIILSSDADFTPVLHRLRSHAKRTVIFANDNTVAPYTALSDGEVRESDLIAHLLGERVGMDHRTALPASEEILSIRDQIIDQVVQAVLEADTPVPLEALAERATRILGHDKTVGTNWAGANSFRELLMVELPASIKLTNEPPFLAFEASRAIQQPQPQIQPQAQPAPQSLLSQAAPEPEIAAPVQTASPAVEQFAMAEPVAPVQPMTQPQVQAPIPQAMAPQSVAPQALVPAPEPAPTQPQQVAPAPVAPAQSAPQPATEQPAPPIAAQDLHQSISRIHAACAAPPFSPPEYRALFAILAQEISDHQLQGVKTLENVALRAGEIGINVTAEDARYVLDAVSEDDPWFEQGATAPLFASRFRNYVVTRCNEHGLNLSAAELDLIDAWFAASPKSDDVPAAALAATPAPAQAGEQLQSETMPPSQPQQSLSVDAGTQPAAQQGQPGGPDWWRANGGAPTATATQPAPTAQQPAFNTSQQARAYTEQPVAAQSAALPAGTDQEDFPRIIRNRLRG